MADDDTPVTRIATVRLKSKDNLTGDLLAYLETESGIARVAVPLQTWLRIPDPMGAEATLTLEVPDGDLEHPTVSAGIRWPW